MAQDNTTADLTEMGMGELLVAARKRLRSALEMLGTVGDMALLDESIAGAGILAHDAGDVLEVLFELRLAKPVAEDEGAAMPAESDLRWKRLAQMKLRQVLELLDADDDMEALGGAFALVEDVGRALDELLQQREGDAEAKEERGIDG